jgi:peptidyl-prolyl cis-trans isomerase D
MAKVKVTKEVTRKHLARAEREARQKRWLLIGVVAVFVIVVGLVGYGYLDERVFKLQQPVATVKNTPITTGDFQKRVRFTRAQITSQINQLEAQRAQFASDPQLSYFTQQIDQRLSSLQQQLATPSLLGGQVLDAMVEEELIRQEATTRGVTVSAQEVQTTIEQSFDFYRVPPTATPTRLPTATPASSPTPQPTATVSITPTATPAPTWTPEPTATPVTEQAFTAEFSSYMSQLAQTDITENDYRELVRVSLLRTKLQEVLGKDVPTSTEQIQFRYVFFETMEGAQAAEAQLKSGLSYDDLYARVQAGQVLSATGSLQPWTPTDEIADTFGPEIEQALLSLAISQTSQIVTDTYGLSYTILQQAGREVQPLTPTQVQDRQQKAFQAWLDSQRTGPDVNLFNNRYLDRLPTQ